ncbi:uncharacterized protein LOC120352360 isoform X2 [Nilaparvata lugens]|uniref:uncharacterized protein LOC120352360 isoform X2 n=1 Tax=Nilaparvata lugens TaxID=108931 RepID=UPI00193DE8D1|nr:uncharacterized protein LOC120352360 isoform X2 [Nilaparvata lugens]
MENGIVMVSLPRHTSHRLQPLDVVFYSPLKAAYRRECDLFMKSRNLVKITPYDISELFNKAYSKVATIAKATSGFEVTGIHPLNPGIFTEEDFLIEQHLPNNSVSTTEEVASSALEEVATRAVKEVTMQVVEEVTESPLDNTDTSTMPQITVPNENISPLPGCSSCLSVSGFPAKKSRPKQHSEILTSTPIKNQLEEKAAKGKIKEERQQNSLKKKMTEKSCNKGQNFTKKVSLPNLT